jgi:hypothetical protein
MKAFSTESIWLRWNWTDREIENPKLLRESIETAEALGFSGLWATVDGIRYDATDRKVIQASVQASQWARCRGIAFWISVDPRQAARSLIARSGERAECLMHNLKNSDPNSLTRVRDNRFSIHLPLPEPVASPWMCDQAVQFIASGLERVFLFKTREGFIQTETVRDVTPQSRINFNLFKNEAEVFGEAACPEQEDWRVIAFIRFDTNAYDFAGMVSNDLLYQWMEDLFDAGACIDGLAWNRPGYPEKGLPISRSLIGCFKNEFGYDARDALPGLVLPMDNGAHVRIRCDYGSLVWQITAEAHRKTHSFAKTFFGSVHGSILGTLPDCGGQTCFSSIQEDPWAELKSCTVGFIDAGSLVDETRLLASCVIAKSLGVFSKGRRAMLNMPLETKQLVRTLELAALYSVDGLIALGGRQVPSSNRRQVEMQVLSLLEIDKDHSPELDFAWLNQRIATIHELTQNFFPDSNVAVVYPIDTLRAAPSETAAHYRRVLSDWIGGLVRSGLQIDVISPGLFRKGRLSSEGFRVGQRFYQAVLYPYPEILNPDSLEILSWMKKKGFPVLLGGSQPVFTTTGKRIPHLFETVFDPETDAIPNLKEWGVPSILEVPNGALATVIPIGSETLVMVLPAESGKTVRGEACLGGVRVEMETSNLAVYSIRSGKAIKSL